MGVLRFLVARRTWRRRPATVAVTLLVTVAVAAVLALAAGARRTATAPERLTREHGGDGLQVTQQSGRPRTAEVAGLPSIQSFTTITYTPVEGGPVEAFDTGINTAEVIYWKAMEGRTKARSYTWTFTVV